MNELMPAPEMPSNVVPFLELSLQNQENQMQTMRILLREMKMVKRDLDDSITEIKAEMHDNKAELQVLVKEVCDSVRLFPSEVDDLYQANRIRSNEIVKAYAINNDIEFKQSVGRVRHMIWRKVNQKFGTSKYIHLRRLDFREALDFINSFHVEDYL